MSSPGQRRGSCGHAMANFDSHAFCARCPEKGKGTDDCVKTPNLLIARFVMPSLKNNAFSWPPPHIELRKRKGRRRNLNLLKTVRS